METIDDDFSQLSDTTRDDTNCYSNCGEERDLKSEVQCGRCLKWFHERCLQSVCRVLPFQTNYTFLCRYCNDGNNELFTRRQTNFSQMCETALANLMRSNPQRISFSKDREIIPFLEHNWDALTTMPRRVKQTWHNTVVKTMAKESEVFISDQRDANDIHFALRNQDLSRIGPNYESKGRAKRKEEIVKRPRSELSSPRLPANGWPTEYPFNKDGYRYVLAEPDPHAPCRQEFDESTELAGKPIPGWLCRKLMATNVSLSLHDRAPQLRVSEERRSVSGEKGYCMVRANYGASHHKWYFETTIDEMPEGAALRLGWSRALANLQTPLGYDKFGFSIRSRKGTIFHESRGRHYSCGYGVGDVMGCLIDLPHAPTLPKTFKEKPLVKFKSFLYFEEKDEIQRAIQNIERVKDSRIAFFKNGKPLGTAFESIPRGTYYPAISLYKGVSVSCNFGPNFQFKPKEEKIRAVSDLVDDQMVAQTLADLVFLVENASRLRLDVFYGN